MHRTYTTVHERRGHVAVCTCGWRSRPAGSAGLVGALWDAHVTGAPQTQPRVTLAG